MNGKRILPIIGNQKKKKMADEKAKDESQETAIFKFDSPKSLPNKYCDGKTWENFVTRIDYSEKFYDFMKQWSNEDENENEPNNGEGDKKVTKMLMQKTMV